MALSRREINKDVLQQSAEAAATTAASVTAIVLGATRQVITEIGDFATEIFDISDAARRARHDPEDGADAEVLDLDDRRAE